MVLLGAYASISIRDLFLGGAIPGVLVGISMLVTATLITYGKTTLRPRNGSRRSRP